MLGGLKKGEGREWDRGKVVDEEGVAAFNPKFGRLVDEDMAGYWASVC